MKGKIKKNYRMKANLINLSMYRTKVFISENTESIEDYITY